jgi:hypothetical protein
VPALRQGAAATIRLVFAMHLGFAATHHPSSVPLFVELAVAAAGGIAVLAAPHLTLRLQALLSRLGQVRAHAPRQTALHR